MRVLQRDHIHQWNTLILMISNLSQLVGTRIYPEIIIKIISKQNLNVFLSADVMFIWQNHGFQFYLVSLHIVCNSGRGMCAVVIKHLSFPWCFSHSSVSSDMLTQATNPKMPLLMKNNFIFLFHLFISGNPQLCLHEQIQYQDTFWCIDCVALGP